MRVFNQFSAKILGQSGQPKLNTSFYGDLQISIGRLVILYSRPFIGPLTMTDVTVYTDPDVGDIGPGWIRQAANLYHRTPWSTFGEAAMTAAGLFGASGMDLALGRQDILTPKMRRELVAHRDRNLTRIDMAPRKRARYGRSGWKKNDPRAITSAQKGYLTTGGYYGKYNLTDRTKWAGEDKFFDVDLNAALAAISVIELKTNLAVIPQGTGESERIGRKIRISSIMVKLLVNKVATSSVSDTGTMNKFEIVLDRQTNGVAYTTLLRLETDTIIRFNNLANASRFSVLKSKDLLMQQQGAGPDGASNEWPEMVRQVTFYKKCGIVIEYDNTLNTGAVSTQRINSLWFAQIGLISGISDIIRGRCRIRYRDV